jgi:hypothetical protein
VLSGRGLCDEPITRPEESYRLCCVVVYDLETSRICAPYIYDISNLRVKLHNVGVQRMPQCLSDVLSQSFNLSKIRLNEMHIENVDLIYRADFFLRRKIKVAKK